MALIMNASNKKQTIRVYGNYFTLAPQQIKMVEDKIAQEVEMTKFRSGFVSLPDKFTDPGFKDTEEGKQLLAEQVKRGKLARIAALKELIHNETISMQQDLDTKNLKGDAKNWSLMRSPVLLDSLEELDGYQSAQDDEKQKQLDRIAELEKSLAEKE